MLKKFNDYIKKYSNDEKTFEKQVILADSTGGIDLFNVITESNVDFTKISEYPVILWNNFKTEVKPVNESHIFNINKIPEFSKIEEDFNNALFIPKSTKDRKQVKTLKFPIIGVSNIGTEEFKTYGKFKKSEKAFNKFKQKIVPSAKFEAIIFKDNVIHIQEKINGVSFDSNVNRFKYLKEINEISSKLYEKYNLDFYYVELFESNGKIYLNKLSTNAPLNPSQSIKMYNAAYSSFYNLKLPKWFNTKIFEKYIKPYYKKSYYDSLLMKPKNSIDFKKYL